MSDPNIQGGPVHEPEVLPAPGSPEALLAAKELSTEAYVSQIVNAPAPVITTDAEYKACGAMFAVCKERLKAVDADAEEIIKPLRQVLDKLYLRARTMRARCQDALNYLEPPMKAWVLEQDRLRKEAEKKAREAAELERQEKEKARLAAEAELERLRLEQEAADKAAEAETNPFLKAARVASAASAAAVVSNAADSFADAVREERRVEAAPLKTAIPFTRAAGTKIKRPYKWRVKNEKEIPDIYWMLNESLISATVKNLKDKTNIPGIEA